MYDNIGGKIKGLAKASFIISTIAEVITGFVYCSIDEDLILYGLLFMFVAPIISWVSSWVLYGFGELIDTACEIEQNTRGGAKKQEAQPKVDPERISKIEMLRSQGLITEDEYQQAISKGE